MCRFTYSQGVDFIEYVVPKLKKGYISLGNEIEIHYPGRKENEYDYKLTYKGKALSHSDICQMLYDITKKDGTNYNKRVRFLERVYFFGTKNMYTNPDLRVLQKLVFWVTLQEDINYSKGYGRKLSFLRYAEAVASRLDDTDFTIDAVKKRANNVNQVRLGLYEFNKRPVFYNKEKGFSDEERRWLIEYLKDNESRVFYK